MPSHPRRHCFLRISRHRLGTTGQNRDIANSRYTVVRHVSNIFQKTNASNRTEATAYAHHHKLV